MMQGMAEQQELLTRLVEEAYDCHGAVLQPISPYQFEDRGIYRVDWEGGTSSVLRAFLADVTVELTGHAAVLDYLQQYGFAAPQVKRTRNGALLACYQGWTALFVSFLEGEVADFTLDSLNLLSACVGRLHTLSHDALAEAENARLPDSRLRPTQLASQAIDQLIQALPHVPNALRQFCEDCIVALQRIQQAQQAGLLSERILHGDCWPGNAVRTPAGGIALIDWDGAGIGPAILDVGYLLLTCHLDKPQLPAMQPNEQSIATVVRGYCQQRRPSAPELSVLEDALLYDVARRAGLEKRLAALSDDWAEEIWLQKMLARYHVSPKIAVIARRYFEQETQTDDSLSC
jgi:Ser/Thr protein kinase RdoA (MazF antagonist)